MKGKNQKSIEFGMLKMHAVESIFKIGLKMSHLSSGMSNALRRVIAGV
ncbi:hypothetical protein ACFL03_00475 [Thermodesulfobacteriota bacterium]